jgi:hypothetical protein
MSDKNEQAPERDADGGDEAKPRPGREIPIILAVMVAAFILLIAINMC